MISDIDSVNEKVLGVFREAFGTLASRLDGGIAATPAIDAITVALSEEYGLEKARDIAFHMADWNWDAAFIVALHLFPERFTRGETNAGIGLFLCHAPNHIRAACGLTGSFVWEHWADP